MDSVNQSGYSRRLIRVLAIPQLIRLPNCLALGLLFIAARRYFGLDTGSADEYGQALLWVMLSAFSYLYNDLRDIKIDKINKPHRPLPGGSVSVKAATIVLACISVVIVVLIVIDGRGSLIWGPSVLLASIAYSSYLRPRTALLSNVVAGSLVAAVPLSGLSLETSRHWALTAGVFLLMFGREIQKDALDMKGDIGWRPIPVLLGKAANIVGVTYPFILIASAFFLGYAMYSSNTLSSIGTLAILFLHSAAIVVFLCNRRAFRLQAVLTKAASYLLVAVLLFPA